MKDQKQQLNDLVTIKTNIISTINKNYWEITEKQQVKARDPQLLVWLGSEPMPATNYNFGKAVHFTSGRSGQIKLSKFLNYLDECKSLEVMVSYTANYARFLVNSSPKLSETLTLAIINAVKSLPESTRVALPERVQWETNWAARDLGQRQWDRDHKLLSAFSNPTLPII